MKYSSNTFYSSGRHAGLENIVSDKVGRTDYAKWRKEKTIDLNLTPLFPFLMNNNQFCNKLMWLTTVSKDCNCLAIFDSLCAMFSSIAESESSNFSSMYKKITTNESLEAIYISIQVILIVFLRVLSMGT